MTLEELTAQVEKLTGELTTVNSNNDKLVKEKREALTRAEQAEASIESANSATLSELEKAIKRAEKAEKDLLASNERAAQLESTRRNERADALIAKALSTSNVNPDDATILSSHLRSMTQFSDEGEPLLQGKDVETFAKEFFGANGAGFRYVRAPNNSGGSATGVDGTKSSGKTAENWNLNEYTALRKTDASAASAWATAAGHGYLNNVT